MVALKARGMPLAFCSLCRRFAQKSTRSLRRLNFSAKVATASSCQSQGFSIRLLPQSCVKSCKTPFPNTSPAALSYDWSNRRVQGFGEQIRQSGCISNPLRSELFKSSPPKNHSIQSARFHLGTVSCSTMSPAVQENAVEVDQATIKDGDAADYGPGVIVRDLQELERKIRAIKEAGMERLQVIADFDMTLTRFLVNGKRGQSCHALVRTENEEVNERRRHVHNKYYPMEIDPTIPHDKKLPLMEEWWATSHSLILEGGLSLQAIQHSVARANIGLREGTAHLFELLHARGVPVLIFSAGLADIIEEVLAQKLDKVYPNVRVVSNRMEFDESGRLVGFKGKVIHVLNKNEHALEMAVPGKTSHGGLEGEENGSAGALRASLHKRTNVILLGDHLGDLRMSDGVACDTRITVGFLNDNVEQQLQAYTAAYDIVVLNDGSMDVIIDLVKSMA